jgi:hypothetical protein
MTTTFEATTYTQPLVEQIAEDTEAPVEVPPESGDPAEPPEEEVQTDHSDEAKQALATAALIIKTATKDIAETNATLTKEAAENAEWAKRLTKAAWRAGTDGGHCSTWDSVMKRVGLPARPQAVTIRVTVVAKVSITDDTMVKALAATGVMFSEESLAVFQKALSGVEYQGQTRQYSNNIAVTPDPPDDPFNTEPACLCPKARKEYVTYVKRNYGADVTAEEVTVETRYCPAKEHH